MKSEFRPVVEPTIYKRDDKWYWADEVWQEHGPCDTMEEADRQQKEYVELWGLNKP